MPIYEYNCPDCETTFELMRPLREADEDAVCPGCHKKARRIMSPCVPFTRDSIGLTTRVSGSGSSCAGCSSSSCTTCGH
jgi:putative FmdB family regulatory protein